MTDPLSVSASMVAVLGAGISVSKAIKTVIQGYREAPVAITALSNEVSDLIVVLQEVRDRNLDGAMAGSLAAALSRADAKLEELRVFVQGLRVIDSMGKWRRTYERARWAEKKKRAQELKSGLRDVKGDIVLLLNSKILSQVKLTEIAVETISQKIEARTLKDDRYHREISTHLVDHDYRVSELIEEVRRTETNVETVSQKLEATALRDVRHHNDMSTHLNTDNHRFSEVLYPIQKMVEEQQNQRQMLQCALAVCDQSSIRLPTITEQGSQIAVGFQNYRNQSRVCSEWCSCFCHRHSKIRSPRFLDPVFGTLFFGYSGIPVLTPRCNESSCWGRRCEKTSLTYYFPNWLLGRVLSVVVLNSLEPTASLKIPRLLSPRAKVFKLVRKGKVKSIKYLFQRGLASPNDINGEYGYSLLYLSLLEGNLKVSEFLLNAGADPCIDNFDGSNAVDFAQRLLIRKWYMKPHLEELVQLAKHFSYLMSRLLQSLAREANFNRSNAVDFAQTQLIRKTYSPSKPGLKALIQLTKQFSFDYSISQRREFSPLHTAVVQDNAQKLRDELELSTKHIDRQDTEGCTALSLAVVRLNVECLELLLGYGADPNIRNKHGVHVLNELSWYGNEDEAELLRRDRCIQLLIQYGRERNGNDFASLADLEYYLVLGDACLVDRHTVVAILLAAGVRIHRPQLPEFSPLDACVYYSSTKSLELILREIEQLDSLTKDQWLKMLETIQNCSDVRTVQVLIDAELVIDGLDPEDWQRLAVIPSYPFWRTWQVPRLQVEEFRSWKRLYKEFVEDLRLSTGFDPVLSPLVWSGGGEESNVDELREEDADEVSRGESEIVKDEEESGGEDGDYEDAVEYQDG